MKKIMKLLILSLFLTLSLISCKKERTSLVIGLDAHFPPMGFYDENNEIVGFDIDLAKEVAKRLNLNFEAKPIEWQDKENELKSGNIDCVWNGFTIADNRQSAFLFSDPYLSNEQVLVVKEERDISSLDQVNQFVIGCQSYSSAETAISSNPNFISKVKSVIYYENYVKAIDALKMNVVDGVVMDSVVADYMISVTGEPLTLINEPLAYEYYGIGFAKDKNGEELKQLVWDTLLQMQLDGTVAVISNRWFGKNKSIIKTTN